MRSVKLWELIPNGNYCPLGIDDCLGCKYLRGVTCYHADEAGRVGEVYVNCDYEGNTKEE